MNFGQAIEKLKQGKRVSREGWNGKDMFIYLVRGQELTGCQLRNEAEEHVKGVMENTNAYVEIKPHIDMKSADGGIVVGWLASQTDILAEDWEVVK